MNLVGCGASSRSAAAPTSSIVDSPRDESMWSPPEDTLVAVREDKEEKPRAERNAASFRPNQEKRPQHGAVRPATY